MRPTVAIYLRTYLGASMTFVHRQRAGVAERFRPLVWCNRLGPGKPPHDGIEVLPQTLPVRATRWLRRRAGGAWSRLSPGEIAQWQRRGEAEGVALIHAHFGPYGVEILPVARALGVPLVVTFHGFGSSVLLERPGYVRQLGPLFEHATVVAASEATAQRLRALGADPIVHYVGAPTDLFARKPRTAMSAKGPDDPIRVIQVARLHPVKGHRYTLEALARVDDPRLRVTFVGDGPLRAALEEQAARLGLAVEFAGALAPEQVRERLHEADLFVHHSVSEGGIEAATTAILEAMATGLPVVASRHGGIPEIIRDGVDGWLVPEHDVDAYADALRAALRDDGSRGEAAAKRVRADFDLAVQNKKLADLYDRVLRNP